jgi:hypothetical protein
VAGERENFGPEQERLNNVLGARLRITTLRAAAGPGVEWLEYLAPRAGRPAPVDLKANDLAYWLIHFVVSDAEAASSAVRAARGALINPGVVALTDGRLGFRHGALARDSHGHAVELAEP